MPSRSRTPAILGWLLALLLAGCVPAAATPTSGPPTPSEPDFTKPGAAVAMVDSLLAEAGSRRALMVEITESSVQVSVLTADDQPVTWAYRGGKSAEVTSDLAYVDQATFDVSEFNISDVGALFRAATNMSGSEEKQGLTIVDYSGGEVTMSVSTFPESQTVFFNPDGSLLQVLNFDAPGGIDDGVAEVLESRFTVYSVTIQSDQGVWAEFPGTEDGTTVRRTRTAKVPVTTNIRNETVDLPLISTSRVRPEVIWELVDDLRGSSEVPEDSKWSVVIDDRDRTGYPRMRFTIGPKSVVTDLNGTITG
ncbi:MAG: hypothetical protein IT193_01200 [Propionibacteriaceae bacterium]|nr:hypothetical protein [Propionibacteriaceae bacterium]